MNNNKIYNQFSADYDRFVKWNERLAFEIPFLTSELVNLKSDTDEKVSILDAACGTGKHLIALADQGFDCAGADISARMVEIARDNALAANYDIPINQAGFGQLEEVFGVSKFDGLICLGNSLPHILQQDEMINTLGNFKAVIRPGGKLIIQNRNFDSVIQASSRWMEPQTHREESKTWIFVRFYDFDPDGRITFNILILSDQKGSEFHQQVISTRLWPIKMKQLVQFLESSGFVDLHLYGDLQGSTFDLEMSGNLVITARAT